MTPPLEDEEITLMGSIALFHLIAEHVLPVLKERPSTHDLVAELIDAGWSWMNSGSPDPSEIYWGYNPRLMEDGAHDVENRRLHAAFYCALDMHYLSIWQALRVVRIQTPGVELSIGNDINEIDWASYGECVRHCLEASPDPHRTQVWLDDLVARMKRECPAKEGDVVGRPLQRASFAESAS